MANTGYISSAFTGLKTAYDVASGFLKLKISAEVQTKVIELQGIIVAAQNDAFAAQAAQSELLEEVRALKEKITQMEAWDAEREQYELKRIDSGAFAYVLKKDEKSSEYGPWYCTACYENRHKSILQNQGRVGSDVILKCPECKNTMKIDWGSRPVGW